MSSVANKYLILPNLLRNSNLSFPHCVTNLLRYQEDSSTRGWTKIRMRVLNVNVHLGYSTLNTKSVYITYFLKGPCMAQLKEKLTLILNMLRIVQNTPTMQIQKHFVYVNKQI